MNRYFWILLLGAGLCGSCGRTYYIVRHAEKAAPGPSMSGDVPLTAEGEERARRLSFLLQKKAIRHVFSTATIRTRSTAAPTAQYFGLAVETYGPRPDSAFIRRLRHLHGHTLVVGHSNTVDDLVNLLAGKKLVQSDLPDDEYNKLFIVRKRGGHYRFEESVIYAPSLIRGSHPRF